MNQTTSSNSSSRRPSLLRSPPSIQLTTYTAHAHTNSSDIDITNEEDNKKLQQQQSRTQHKMMLQRQSFLADDKNYLDHPDNMRRLTKELERVNREYRCLKQFQDPFALSVQRVLLQSSTYLVYNNSPITTTSPTTPSIASSICSSNHSQSPPTSKLQRRASSHTVHDYLLNFKEERRHSFSIFNDKSSTVNTTPGFMNRIFFGSNQSLSPSSSQQQQHHQFKRYPHLV